MLPPMRMGLPPPPSKLSAPLPPMAPVAFMALPPPLLIWRVLPLRLRATAKPPHHHTVLVGPTSRPVLPVPTVALILTPVVRSGGSAGVVALLISRRSTVLNVHSAPGVLPWEFLATTCHL